MLVLQRKVNEVIRIGDDIQVVLVDIRGEKVRLGIIAPKDIPVHRQEVYKEIKKQEREQDRIKAKEVLKQEKA